MDSQYGESLRNDDFDGVGHSYETSSEDLRQRYPQLDGLSGMDDEQKIEAFRDVLGILREDLDSRR